MITPSNQLPESPTIRPPSEWRSILIRVTRGCKWNRCKFCGIYPHLGVHAFSTRNFQEIKSDIDYFHERRPEGDTVFLGDSDPLQAGLKLFTQVTRYIHSCFTLKRLTCYARTSTLDRLGGAGITELGKAGLTRVHIGLESGNDDVLRFQRKGQSAAMVKRVSQWLKKAGIEISFYVLLGLGGADNWQPHILSTATLLNDIEPDFIRLRRLWIYGDEIDTQTPESPLWKHVRDGSFIPQTPEGTVLELQLLLEHLQPMNSFLLCDHSNNFVQVSGLLKTDLAEMRAEVDAFLSLPDKNRQDQYRAVGSHI